MPLLKHWYTHYISIASDKLMLFVYSISVLVPIILFICCRSNITCKCNNPPTGTCNYIKKWVDTEFELSIFWTAQISHLGLYNSEVWIWRKTRKGFKAAVQVVCLFYVCSIQKVRKNAEHCWKLNYDNVTMHFLYDSYMFKHNIVETYNSILICPTSACFSIFVSI